MSSRSSRSFTFRDVTTYVLPSKGECYAKNHGRGARRRIAGSRQCFDFGEGFTVIMSSMPASSYDFAAYAAWRPRA